MDIILKTTQLTKRFGEKIAVDRVNMTVERGDIYGFIGKNGAGKTTVMRMAVGTTFPTEGSIELFNGENLDSARYKIGSLIEAPGLYGGCTARENLRRIAILCGKREDKIDELLNFVGLENVGNKKASAFSLGMKQRLGIAIALVGDPEFMVLDEPINGLDPEGIKAIRDLVLTLNRERGITFLISSHLLDELAKIVTKYGIINEGKLVEEVRADELKSRITDGLKVTVSDVNAALDVISRFTARENLRVKEHSILLTGSLPDPAALNTALIRAGIGVSELYTHVGSLEKYFIERIGK